MTAMAYQLRGGTVAAPHVLGVAYRLEVIRVAAGALPTEVVEHGAGRAHKLEVHNAMDAQVSVPATNVAVPVAQRGLP